MLFILVHNIYTNDQLTWYLDQVNDRSGSNNIVSECLWVRLIAKHKRVMIILLDRLKND